MQELINILKGKHGFSEDQSKSVIETFINFIKEKHPEALPSLGNFADHSADKTSFYTTEQKSSSPAASYIPDSALKDDQQLSKDKQSGFYEGNKKDY